MLKVKRERKMMEKLNKRKKERRIFVYEAKNERI